MEAVSRALEKDFDEWVDRKEKDSEGTPPFTADQFMEETFGLPPGNVDCVCKIEHVVRCCSVLCCAVLHSVCNCCAVHCVKCCSVNLVLFRSVSVGHCDFHDE